MEIGSPSWNTSDIKKAFDEFVEIYGDKPVTDNQGGMKAPHAFASYFMLKRMQPKVIIESGVWKGQGTWLFEKACPDAQIICLDIDFTNLIYRSSNAEYIEKDFSYLSVDTFDTDQTICFFDDHQSAFMRLQQMKWKGLKRAIFEDNYPISQGDCYSLKKIFSNAGFFPEKRKDFRGKTKELISKYFQTKSPQIVSENSTHSMELRNSLDLYYEFPPLFKERFTRWGDEWTEPAYPTKPPIFDTSFNHKLRQESVHYNWICYVELKGKLAEGRKSD
tara:strand:+ start:218 stop:1045 length:828 start_codon:yes stop_codon:yes gene_type:complete